MDLGELERKFDRVEESLVKRRNKVTAKEALVDEIAALVVEKLRKGRVRSEKHAREVIREELRKAINPRRIQA